MSVRLRLKGVGGHRYVTVVACGDTGKVLAIIEGHTKAVPNPNFDARGLSGTQSEKSPLNWDLASGNPVSPGRSASPAGWRAASQESAVDMTGTGRSVGKHE